MRVIGVHPYPHFKVTIYQMERWWYVECEAGPMKQGYRFNKDEVTDLPALQTILNGSFLEKVRGHFNAMFPDYREALKNQ